LPLNHLQLFLDQAQALTTEDIRQAFARHFDPERRLVVTVGPAALAVPQPEEQLDEEVQSEEDALSGPATAAEPTPRTEEHTSELQSRENLVCRLLLEKKKYQDTKAI